MSLYVRRVVAKARERERERVMTCVRGWGGSKCGCFNSCEDRKGREGNTRAHEACASEKKRGNAERSNVWPIREKIASPPFFANT